MTNLGLRPEFSEEDWSQAPQYWGPSNREMLSAYGGVLAIDFEQLEMIAEMQRDRGAFRPDNDQDVSLAPIKVGHNPGALVSVESKWSEDYFTHHTDDVEVFVVINGVLEVERIRSRRWSDANALSRGFLRQGDAVALRPGDVQLTAHGVDRKASGLALSILGLSYSQAHFIVSYARYNAGREFDLDFKPKLPYDSKKED